MEFLAVPCARSRNLRWARTISAYLLQVFLDLYPTRTRCFQILLREALDLWLTMRAALYLIAKTLQSHCELGSIHAGRILLRLKQAALLQCSRLPVVEQRLSNQLMKTPATVELFLEKLFQVDRTVALYSPFLCANPPSVEGIRRQLKGQSALSSRSHIRLNGQLVPGSGAVS
jgi:hypothetical protein